MQRHIRQCLLKIWRCHYIRCHGNTWRIFAYNLYSVLVQPIRHFVPVQVVPFPAYPWRHVHTYEPSVFVQFACRSHLLKVLLEHSSMSKTAILTDIDWLDFFINSSQYHCGIYCKCKTIFYEDFHTCTIRPIPWISIETSTIIRAFGIGTIGFRFTFISRFRCTFVNVCWECKDLKCTVC